MRLNRIAIIITTHFLDSNKINDIENVEIYIVNDFYRLLLESKAPIKFEVYCIRDKIRNNYTYKSYVKSLIRIIYYNLYKKQFLSC